jgi:hypothetical protein
MAWFLEIHRFFLGRCSVMMVSAFMTELGLCDLAPNGLEQLQKFSSGAKARCNSTVTPGLKPRPPKEKRKAGPSAPLGMTSGGDASLRNLATLGALDEDAGQVLAVVIRQYAPENRNYSSHAQAHRIHEHVVGQDVHKHGAEEDYC